MTKPVKESPFVIAELSGNHNQSFSRAMEMIDAAANTGVSSVKLQTFTSDTLTLPVSTGEFYINDARNLWNGHSLHDLYEIAHTPWEWHEALFRAGEERGLTVFSTPFDETAVDFLEELGCPFYKVASFENNHLPLLRRVGATGKPVIVSTGMASLAELDECVRTLRESGCGDLVLLQCTSTYPATPENSNLRTIPHMRDLFGCEVGLSDHTLGIGAAVAAVALGATVIEKHFTLSRAEGGVDAAFSLEPEEMRALVEETGRAAEALGTIHYGHTEAEKASLAFRRSCYIAKDLQVGDTLTPENLRIIRPGHGVPPRDYDQLLGMRVNRDLKMGTAMRWEYVG